MNRILSLVAALLLVVALWPGAAHSAGRVTPWQVTNLAADTPVCTGPGLYAYNASWTPIAVDNKPWASYNVVAHNCAASAVVCSATRCSVKASGCKVGAPGPWISVQANIGQSVAGVRANAAPTSRCQ